MGRHLQHPGRHRRTRPTIAHQPGANTCHESCSNRTTHVQSLSGASQSSGRSLRLSCIETAFAGFRQATAPRYARPAFRRRCPVSTRAASHPAPKALMECRKVAEAGVEGGRGHRRIAAARCSRVRNTNWCGVMPTTRSKVRKKWQGFIDASAARRFYDAAPAPLGARCLSEGDGSLGYGRETVTLWILDTAHPVAPDKRSGLHLRFRAPYPYRCRCLPRRGARQRRPRQRGSRGCAVPAARTTMPRACWTPMATASRPTAMSPAAECS